MTAAVGDGLACPELIETIECNTHLCRTDRIATCTKSNLLAVECEVELVDPGSCSKPCGGGFFLAVPLCLFSCSCTRVDDSSIRDQSHASG